MRDFLRARRGLLLDLRGLLLDLRGLLLDLRGLLRVRRGLLRERGMGGTGGGCAAEETKKVRPRRFLARELTGRYPR